MVLIAGDLVSDKTLSTRASIRLAESGRPARPARGRGSASSRCSAITITGATRRGARARCAPRGVTLARQSGGRSAGPLAIGGLDDDFTRQRRSSRDAGGDARGCPARRVAAQPQPRPVRDAAGRRRPDARRPHPLRPDPAALLSARSRRCRDYGERYACGLIRRERPDADRHRGPRHQHPAAPADGAVPDLWMVTLGARCPALSVRVGRELSRRKAPTRLR